MNILYITPSFPRVEEGDNIYTDLAEELNKKYKITIVVGEEKNKIKNTQMQKERGIKVLRVKIGNLYGVSFIEKGITFVSMQRKIKKAINKYIKKEKFDLILFMAPPVTLGNIVKYAMKKYNAKSYLMQKDIFPQNAIDIGILTKWNPMYWYFRYKECLMYKTASVIGCMSEGNIEYLLKNNKFLNKEKLELFPNTAKSTEINKENLIDIRKKYNISEDEVLAIYGGNFGKPQGINFIIQVIDKYKDNKKIKFLFCGSGTEKDKLYHYIKEYNINNVITLDYMPREEYNLILEQADIGLVFLDYRFTIPNIPSRTLSYLQRGIPIMAATDKNTDYRSIIEDNEIGRWAYSDDIEDFKMKFDELIENNELRKKLGDNEKKYFEKNLTTFKSVRILEETYKKIIKEDENV